MKKLGKSPKRGFEKKSANKKTLALIPLLPGVISKQGLKVQRKTSLGLCITIVSKKGTLSGLVPNLRRIIL